MVPASLFAAVAIAVAFATGMLVDRLRTRARLRRVSDGLAELANGNLAHRVILPGNDGAARMAADLNDLADAVQRDTEAASARDEALRRLLANISHDLRTPITSIAGYVDALQRGLGDDPQRYIEVLAMKTDELAQLTDDLFYAARLDAGELELTQAPVDLAEAVRRCVLGFEPLLAARGVRVSVDVPEDRCMVQADRGAVGRILSNVVSNAVRHGTGMTSFRVSLAERGGCYLVEIADDGVALPEDPERLFRRGVAGPGGGAGLGLSIARELAEHMGGTLTADGARGEEVTFVLAFPRRLEDADSA